MRILAYNTHVTFNGIGTALALRSAGGLSGNTLGGVFQKVIQNHADLLQTISVITLSLRVLITPYTSLLMALKIVLCLQGTPKRSISISEY
ncbi:unnamed protein product [Adineta ricciae]|uniref:Uncharacterized protein n=1 Tax=Adineta ricciae TaxID=249248 RepID=A0A814PSQ0_ADIRI|nr:unnamed protein product [Adineta ricciae]